MKLWNGEGLNTRSSDGHPIPGGPASPRSAAVSRDWCGDRQKADAGLAAGGADTDGESEARRSTASRGRQVVLPGRLVGVALPSVARPIAVGRQSETTTSLDRLDTECGEQLRVLGLSKNDGDDRWWRRSVWTDRRWRPVWTGYTPEQRRLIRVGNKPLTLSHKELV
jgi:hypothetical protein